MKEYEKIIEKAIRAYPEISYTGAPVSEDGVRAAERELGIMFPEEYRTFLKKYGMLRFGSVEIYGIPAERMKQIPDGIWATGYLRQIKLLPHAYLVIGFDGFGGYYCLDTARTAADGTCPVVDLDLNDPVTENTQMERISDSFWKFMFDEIRMEAKSLAE